MSKNYRILADEIVSRSESNEWGRARLEWDLHLVYEADYPDECLCTHTPIREICILRNVLNNCRVVVGNVCVKNFMELPSDAIFRAIKRVRGDEEASLNDDTLRYVYKRNWINDWEYRFYRDVMHKRKPTLKQLDKKAQVNRKVLRNLRQDAKTMALDQTEDA